MSVIEAETSLAENGRRGRPSAETTRKRMAHLLSVARDIFIRRGYRATTMAEVAAAAGVTKRTLYAWHDDKESLFRACVLEGAQRFPNLEPQTRVDLKTALEDYVVALHKELSRESSYGFGLLFMREGAEFPSLADYVQQPHSEYLIKPLAAFLRLHGLEEADSTDRTALFVNMALSPLHNSMMLGVPLPDEEQIKAHGRLCVAIFTEGGRGCDGMPGCGEN